MIAVAEGVILRKGDFGSFMLQKISELEGKSGIRLPLAHKILLAETGTVEQVLSILIGSAVSVRVVKQSENARTITRGSVITSSNTGRVLIRARSKIFVSNLPAKVVNQIKQKQAGIGTIIQGAGLETFRKIVQVGYDPAARSVFRKYQIIYRKKIAFEIREELALESGPGWS
jgi:chorismate-pyruvate lyase